MDIKSLILTVPILMQSLFIKYFLNIKQYTKINSILNIIMIIIVFNTFITIFANYMILLVLLILYLVFITIFGVFKKNRQSYFILFGWILISIALIFMYLSGIGVYNISETFPYMFETLFISEALLFSIALADKINQLQNEKNIVDEKLIVQQASQKEELQIEVHNKTLELQDALSVQTTLLQELNHRVKNNMQTVISLLRLQSDQIDDENIQEIFLTIQNRINAMNHLHELLYRKSDITHIDSYEYFEILISELQDSYENEFDISYDIDTNLCIDDAISCGIILNELVTNSFKYAFENQYDGHISVSLVTKGDTIIFNISDNGVGYTKESIKKSFGLILVETLVIDTLKGSINIDSQNNGVHNEIKWKHNG